ncbi:restin homolog [Littorina saxatilis]|uniref:Uncharacterized protein n=1 Tax=Littorina saxatilis TaxID=31220 RepID=A0AAN9GNG8_9CAEN
MAIATKLGVALLVTLASNATLLSLLIREKGTITTNTNTTTTTGDKTHSDNHDHGHTAPASNLQSNRLSQELPNKVRGSATYQEFPEEAARQYQDREPGAKDNPPHRPQGRRRGDQVVTEEIQEEKEDDEFPPRTERSTLKRAETGHHLNDVIATLTEGELEQLDDNTAKILIPALVGLESMVLRELEMLHDVSVRQELRLERLEKSQLQGKEVMEAANIIREEKYLMQRKEQEEALRRQLGAKAPAPQTPQPQPVVNELELGEASAEIIDFENANLSSSASLEKGEGSGSGDEPIVVRDRGSEAAATATTTVNYTESSDSAIINHIYEIYSSLTSMEHQVMELGTSLSTVSSELYRQRSTFVRLEDKVEELRRNQRTLVMRSTMHTFKLSDLEQFKGQAEMLLRAAEGTIGEFDAKLEIFKDRVTEQQDVTQTMRSTFGRLEQTANELRAADAYKAHDIQELKRTAQQFETRLSNLYHSLDRYIGNVRWDVKTYLDHLCSNNNLQC